MNTAVHALQNSARRLAGRSGSRALLGARALSTTPAPPTSMPHDKMETGALDIRPENSP
jgi:hypothetical protein